MDVIFLVNRMDPGSRSYLSYHSVNRGGIELDALAVFGDTGDDIIRGGECGGLLFFRDDDDDDGRVLICNPTTKERKFLPPSQVSDPLLGDVYEGYGFGYDESSQDFKILRFFRRDAEEYPDEHTTVDAPMRAEIYSFKTNCWKEIPCPKSLSSVDYLSDGSIAAFVNGNLYWAATFSEDIYDDGEHALLSFNLAAEDFSLFPLPLAGTDDARFDEYMEDEYMQDIFELDGELGAFVYDIQDEPKSDEYDIQDIQDDSESDSDSDDVQDIQDEPSLGSDEDEKVGIQIWVWKPEEGSWVKKFSFLFGDVVTPLALKNGLLYLEVRTDSKFTQLRVYNVNTGEFVNLEVYAYWGKMEIFPYTRSTFPLPKDAADAIP